MADQAAALAQIKREFGHNLQLDDDVLLSVLEIHAGDVPSTLNFLRAGQDDYVEQRVAEGEERLPEGYMSKPHGWADPREAQGEEESESVALKARLLNSEASAVQVIEALRTDLGVAVALLLVHQGVEPSQPCKAKLLAAAYATRNWGLADFFLSRPNYLFGLPEVLKATKLLDTPRRVRQISRKLERLADKAQGKARARTLRRVRAQLTELSREYSEAQVTSVSGALVKRIKRWARSIPREHLEFFLLQMPKEPWRELCDVCHFAPGDFQLDWFLSVVYGKAPPSDCLLNTTITPSNVLDVVKRFRVPYSFLRKQQANLPDAVREEVARYEALHIVLWYQEELACPGVERVLVERLRAGEEPDMPYGKLMERMLTFRAAGKQLYELLIPLAERRLKEIDLPLEPPVACFGDASYSMDVAIRTATIISSLLSVLAQAELRFFNVRSFPPDLVATTVPEVIQVAAETRADGLTAPACTLLELYREKRVVKTMIVVTDEIENEPSGGHFFAQLFYKYYTEVYRTKLVFVSFLEDPNRKGRMVNALESLGIVPLQFRLHSGRPDLTKLDSLLGLISSETSIFPVQANALAATFAATHDVGALLAQLKVRRPRETPSAAPGPANPEPEARWEPPEDLDVPHEFSCPITSELMRDPVVAADGMTYERAAIEQWFQEHATSPITNEPLNVKMLFPNQALKSQIGAWAEEQQRKE